MRENVFLPVLAWTVVLVVVGIEAGDFVMRALQGESKATQRRRCIGRMLNAPQQGLIGAREQIGEHLEIVVARGAGERLRVGDDAVEERGRQLARQRLVPVGISRRPGAWPSDGPARHAWMLGYTPELSVSVFVGGDEAGGAVDAGLPKAVWGTFLEKLKP